MKAYSVDEIINAYGRFVPHQLLHLLGKDSVTDIVLGESLEKKMTILFSDIRDFTALSESMTPRQNFSFINSYLECMEPVISGCHGVIDKYIGDAIMALFPTSADDALESATGMLKRLAEYNEQRGKTGDQPIRIGIGLNTGLMMLGTIGGRERMESTVISDAVNLASRIESMTKNYGVSLLISEHTYYSLSDASRFSIRFADRVRVKGKEWPQSIYEVFDADPPEQRAAKQRTTRIFERAVAFYYFKEAEKAVGLFRQCLDECPQDKLAKSYIDRCERFLSTGVHEGSAEADLSVEWSREYEVGQPEIDEQHRKLFVSVNDFASTLKKDRNFSQAGPMINFLDEYVRTHFKDEEDIMESNGYPFLDAQKEEHERFTRLFSHLKSDIEDDTGSDWHFLLFRIQVLVVDWLVHHTCKSDRHIGKFLRLQKTTDKMEG